MFNSKFSILVELLVYLAQVDFDVIAQFLEVHRPAVISVYSLEQIQQLKVIVVYVADCIFMDDRGTQVSDPLDSVNGTTLVLIHDIHFSVKDSLSRLLICNEPY